MTATALKRPATIPVDGDRPDRSEAAAALRRHQHEMAMADNALEGCFPDPAANYIHERWIRGETTSDECIAELKEFIRRRFEEKRRG